MPETSSIQNAKITYRCPDANAYVKTLNDKERKALWIARDHLKSSFDIKKSIGFQEYMKNK
mgnify:CR=1 FL=1|jgi:hypothetical protein